MHTLRILIASSDRVAASKIEGLVLDACFDRAEVECKYTPHLADIENVTRVGWPNLIIVSPDHLLVPSGQRAFRQIMSESLQLISRIRKETLLPFIAFSVSEHDTMRVFDAGADAVFGPFWDGDQFKNELDRLLRLPAKADDPAQPARWQFLSSFFKGLTLAR